MAGPRAKASVVLRDPDGNVRVFEEGHVLPKWALAEITNPEVVDFDELDEGEGAAEAPADPESPPSDEKPKPRTRARRAPVKTAAK